MNIFTRVKQAVLGRSNRLSVDFNISTGSGVESGTNLSDLRDKCPPWDDAIAWRVDQISQLEFKCKNPAIEALLKNPNENDTQSDMLSALVDHYLFHGNAYIRVFRGAGNVPVSMYVLNPDNVKPQYNKDGDVEYSYKPRSYLTPEDYVMLNQDEVIHFKWKNDGNLKSKSASDKIRILAKQYVLAMEATDFALEQRKSATLLIFGHALLSDEEADAIRETVKDSVSFMEAERAAKAKKLDGYVGAVESPRLSAIAVPVNQVTKIEYLTPPALEDSSTKQIVDRAIHGIAAMLNVPPFAIGADVQNRYSDTSQKYASATRDGTYPMLITFLQALNKKLLTPQQRADGEYITANIFDLLNGDTIQLSQTFGQTLSGVYTLNERREALGLDPVEGGDVMQESQAPRVPSGDPNRPFAGEDPEDEPYDDADTLVGQA